MQLPAEQQQRHIILIGFKHVGKTVIGKAAAAKLNKPFIDLDQQIEILFTKQCQAKLSCREILLKHGQDYFRELEHKALQNIINVTPAIIALGGGAPIYEKNSELLTAHLIIHVIAPPEITYARIMANGRPGFFSTDEDPQEAFNKLWNEREHIYQRLANFSINNDGTINQAVEQILKRSI